MKSRDTFAPALRGLLWGLGLSLIISTIVVGIFAAIDYVNINLVHGGKTSYCTDGVCDPGSTLVMLIPLSPYAFIFGFIPATFIGLVGGPLVGLLVSRRACSQDQAMWIGTKVVALLCAPWFIVSLFTIIGMFFIAPACLVCILLGGWVAKRLYRFHAVNETNSDGKLLSSETT